jgi:hypothetical protein
MRRAATLFCIAALSAPVTAEEVAPIFEIPFGQPLARPFAKCDDATRDRMDWCQKFGDARSEIFLSRPYFETTKKIPSWITSGVATVKLDAEGKVARIMVTTSGPARQEAVIESVTGRFGKPTVLEEREAKNAYGAAWNVTRAVWALPSTRIFHDCFRRDECVLVFETPEEHQRRESERSTRKEKDRM